MKPGRLFRTSMLWLLVSVTTPPALADSRLPEGWQTRFALAAVDSVLLPGLRVYEARIQVLHNSIQSLCATPSQSALETTKDAFRRTVRAWHAIRPFNYGPMAREAGVARIQFWPGRGGRAQRHLGRALKAASPGLLMPGALAAQSVAIADWQALERILFGNEAVLLATDAYPCAFAAAIAAHQLNQATALLDQWTFPDGHRFLIQTSVQGNAAYQDAQEAATELIKALNETLQLVATKLERPAGKPGQPGRPKRSEHWRSKMSLGAITTNLETLQFVAAADEGLNHWLAQSGDVFAGGVFAAQLNSVAAEIEALNVPLSELVTTEFGAAKALGLARQVRNASRYLREFIAPRLKVLVGFNAHDGD